MGRVICYEAPKGAVGNDAFTVNVRAVGGEWQPLFVYEVKVDMHEVRRASMAAFDMEGPVDVEVISNAVPIREAVIRPLSFAVAHRVAGNAVYFTLEQPRKLSIEINGLRFANLHLFANPVERDVPDPEADHVLFLKPAIHRTEDIYRLAQTPKREGAAAPDTLYFGPGMHYLEETILRIPSHTTVYLAGGAILVGSLVCDRVEHVSIRGRGIVYLSDYHRFSAFRGIRIRFAEHVSVEGITTLDPPHYSIYLGQSRHIRIANFKSFSTCGWSDGIDIMACEHVDIDDVFLRTSDDCIAIYGSRWDYYGDTRHVTVRNSVLWADVAHPLMIGTHGDHHRDGDTIEHIGFDNIDILEHHEPQPNYMGTMTINAGDKNTVRHVTYRSIRVEDFELGRLVDLRVVWNKDYNPVPGSRIEDIRFEDVSYWGANTLPSQIFGYDEERPVIGVQFKGLMINGVHITGAKEGGFVVNEHTHDVTFTLL